MQEDKNWLRLKNGVTHYRCLEKNIPDNNTPAEITEIMPKSFRLGDSSLTRETVSE